MSRVRTHENETVPRKVSDIKYWRFNFFPSPYALVGCFALLYFLLPFTLSCLRPTDCHHHRQSETSKKENSARSESGDPINDVNDNQRNRPSYHLIDMIRPPPRQYSLSSLPFSSWMYYHHTYSTGVMQAQARKSVFDRTL